MQDSRRRDSGEAILAEAALSEHILLKYIFFFSSSNLMYQEIINRPGVAGAVLQSPPSLINLFIH